MYVRVDVTPGARTESVAEVSADHLHVAVREKAERNMANKRVREIIATRFGCPDSAVRLVAGHRSRHKIFNVALPKDK